MSNRWEKVSIESGGQPIAVGLDERRLEGFAHDVNGLCKTVINFGKQTGKLTAVELLQSVKGVSDAIINHKALPSDTQVTDDTIDYSDMSSGPRL